MLKDFFQHYCNELHVFCLFRKLGMPVRWAKVGAKFIRILVHPIIYKNKEGKK